MAGIRNLDFIRSLPPGVTLQELGTRLYEALSDVDAQQKTIAQQTNANPTGQPLPPPAIDGLTVTGQNGSFHVQIQHGGEFYRGVQYHVEHADNPSFQKPHTIDLGSSREHTVFLGNGTHYWRAFAAYGSSPAGPPAYHGGPHSPQPVSGGGIVGPPAFLDPQGSGTGAPGEGLSGPGPIPFRTSTGRPPIRGESIASGGSSGGSLDPGPQTGLPAGMGFLVGGGGGAITGFRFVSVAQSGMAALAATLGISDASQVLAYVNDFDHFLLWTGSAWTMIGDRSGYIAEFDTDPNPTTGWQLLDGTQVTFLKPDGTLGTTGAGGVPALPDLVSAPGNAAYVKLGTPVSGPNAAVEPTFTPGAIAAAATGVTATTGGASSSQNITQTGIGSAPQTAHTHAVSISDPTHTHTIGAGTIGTDGEPRNMVLRPWFRR